MKKLKLRLLKKKKTKDAGIAVIIRWHYTPEFARALGLKMWGKGRARRIDVKKWALEKLDEASIEAMDESPIRFPKQED